MFKVCTICMIIYTTTCLKPFSLRQEAVWRVECELGIISDVDCPVDGGWAQWGSWSACAGACDGVGTRRRVRFCTNPTPANNGLPCTGPDEETENCFVTNCSEDDYRKLVHGDPTRTDALHQLETVPALMERCLQNECTYEAIETALKAENTWQLNAESLWNSLLCVKYNLGCSIVGEWSTWGKWSACGSRCGEGVRWRLRLCDTPPPSESHLICLGSPLQAEACEGDQCAIDELDVENGLGGTWNEWGAWSSCSENCGNGIRRRKRTCKERHTTDIAGTWGTHCQGQHDQLEVCVNKKCVLNGGWSGWSIWGPCSKSCGSGKRSRSRSCTRPIPAGGGTNCIGCKTEFGTCNLGPCEVYTHTVAILTGDSFLHFNLVKRHSYLFHAYLRFMPLSPHGTLIRRGSTKNPLARLSLQNWRLCLDASGLAHFCTIPRICTSSPIDPAVWHSALISVTSDSTSLRIDDSPNTIRRKFLCDPELPDEHVNITVGERLHGEFQDLIVNFIPLKIIFEHDRNKKSDLSPSFASNVAYENANKEEAYLVLDADQYINVPCFENQDEWNIEMTLKPKTKSGTLLLLYGKEHNNRIMLSLFNSRVKLEWFQGHLRSERSSTQEYNSEWLDITISKKRESSTIELSINDGERLHIFLDQIDRKCRENNFKTAYGCLPYNNSNLQNVSNNIKLSEIKTKNKLSPSICTDEFHIGGMPMELKKNIDIDLSTFNGILASLRVNNILLDLQQLSRERNKNYRVQVSSRASSISDMYHEVMWGRSNNLSLSCLHARTMRSPNSAYWLYLDTNINYEIMTQKIRSIDDGRLLRLITEAGNDLVGFYTCRVHCNGKSHNMITYGIVGKVDSKLTGPDTTTAIAVITTLTLVISTVVWLLIECIYDVKNGYGFFRDPHLSPEEEAEAICSYIDQNMHLIGSKSAVKIAKARARRKAQRLASKTSFAAQEPQGLMQMNRDLDLSTSSDSGEKRELDELPALPAINSKEEPTHEVYRCEPSYISSPRHGSNITPRKTHFTSSSSFGLPSPRYICSHLLRPKRSCSSTESLITKRKQHMKAKISQSAWPRLLTIKSSSYVNMSPTQKILQRFKDLKSEDS